MLLHGDGERHAEPVDQLPGEHQRGSHAGICGAVVNLPPLWKRTIARCHPGADRRSGQWLGLPPGTTTVTYQATDAVGNTAQCSFTVTVTPTDNDADGVCDSADLDDDNDGVPDTAEGGSVLDTDGDGVPNRFDLDSDNDGIYDCVESGSGQAFTAGVLNGAVTANGIPVSVDANANNVVDYTIRDSDSDGTIDSLELDADADGCSADVIEAAGGCEQRWSVGASAAHGGRSRAGDLRRIIDPGFSPGASRRGRIPPHVRLLFG